MVASEKASLLVTGSADQTLRLWNLKTHELIVSMFFAGSQWIAWMPQGYYYSSDEGDKLIGWHVNQGRDHEGRFIRAGQLKK
ncbi:WD40 repeat domain-containing protein, partial [Mesorhizobium sp. M2D.F.Ca.ET.140.01.1.1]